MYAIAFDLIVSDLKMHYGGNNYQNAYFEVKKTGCLWFRMNTR